MKITRRGIFVDVIVVYDEVKHLTGRKLENMKKTKNTRRAINSMSWSPFLSRNFSKVVSNKKKIKEKEGMQAHAMTSSSLQEVLQQTKGIK